MSTIQNTTAPIIPTGTEAVSVNNNAETSTNNVDAIVKVAVEKAIAGMKEQANTVADKEATEVKAQNKPADQAASFKCPGHTQFFHRYTDRERAKRKASQEVENIEKQPNIKKAIYNLISKKSPEGKNTVYFNGLNSIYKYAIDIISYHNDGCTDCEFNPLFEAKK